MRVIVVSDYAMVNGGAGKVALESARALADVVESVTVFAAIGEASSFLLDKPNLNVHSLGQAKVTEQSYATSILGGLWNKEAEKQFAKVLDQHDPKDTIIHVHSWRDGLTLSFMTEVIRRGFKFVFTVHDYGLACPLAGFYNHRTKSICHLRGGSFGCVKTPCTAGSAIKRHWFLARYYMQVHRAKVPAKLEHIIVIGPTTERLMKPYLPETTTIHRVPNFVDVDKHDRIQAEENEIYAFVGRYSPEKDPVIVAQATHALGVPAKFIGTGPLVDEILIRNPEARMMGWRRPDEVKALLQKVRAIIFPSVWYEGQPLVIDEAAALGLPVIVSDVSAATDAVKRFQHGLVFEAGNVESLIRRIKECQYDDVVKSFSEAGYANYWKSPMTMATHIKNLLGVYDQILSESVASAMSDFN